MDSFLGYLPVKQLKKQSSEYLDYIETLWLRQMDQDGFLIAEINKVLDTLKSDKISFKKSSSAVFLQAVHFGTLKREMGVEHLKAIIEVPEILVFPYFFLGWSSLLLCYDGLEKKKSKRFFLESIINQVCNYSEASF